VTYFKELFQDLLGETEETPDYSPDTPNNNYSFLPVIVVFRPLKCNK
jgi:hypothetical protein